MNKTVSTTNGNGTAQGVKPEILLASHQLSALLLNFSEDPDSFIEQLEPRRSALFELMADLSVKIDNALTEASHG